MIRKFFILNLIAALLACTNLVDGFDVTTQKFKISHHIANEADWGNLFDEGYEINVRAAELADGKLKGGHFDENIQTVIPKDIDRTEIEWRQTKEKIAQLIGPLPSSFESESFVWENSSETIDDLLNDVHLLAPTFKNDFQKIAHQHESVANFGPGNEYLLKSKESLVDKIERNRDAWKVSEGEAVRHIGDSLRGTLIVDQLDKIPELVRSMMAYADEHGGRVDFKNLWKEDRESGYVGIHARLLLPVATAEGTHYILAEMQIHLDSIMDGTALSAKERAHLIYENVRAEHNTSSELSAASKLLFLVAMQEALEKIHHPTAD